MDATQVSARAVAKVVLVATAVIAALYFSYLIRTVIGLVVVAAFFAIAIAPAVNWLDRRKVPRWAAILLVYLGIAGGIFGIGLLIVPPLVTGVETLSSNLDTYAEDLRNNPTFAKYDDEYHITEKLQEQAKELPSKLGDAAGTLRDVTVGVFSRFVQLFGILVGIVVAFAADFPIGLIVWVAVLILYQQVENNLIQPFVYGKAVQIHPLIVIIAILIGAALLGVLGALIAIPAAAAVQAVARDYWRFRHPEQAPPPDSPAEAPAEAG